MYECNSRSTPTLLLLVLWLLLVLLLLSLLYYDAYFPGLWRGYFFGGGLILTRLAGFWQPQPPSNWYPILIARDFLTWSLCASAPSPTTHKKGCWMWGNALWQTALKGFRCSRTPPTPEVVGRLRKLRARIWHPLGASQSFCHHHTRRAPVHYTTPRTICSATRERLLLSATSSSKAGARPSSDADRRSSLPAFLTLVPSRLPLTPVPSLSN